MSWKAVAAEIAQRRASNVADEWVALGDPGDELSLSDTLPQIFEEIDFNSEVFDDIILETPGVLLNAKAELLVLHAKAARANSVCREILKDLSLGWGIADFYNSTLISMKYLSACFGYFTLQMHGKSVLIDVFPYLESGAKRQHKVHERLADLQNPIRLLTPKGRKLEHKNFFEITQSIARSALTENSKVILNRVKSFNRKNYTPLRNLILYDACFWPYGDDLYGPSNDICEVADYILSSSDKEKDWITTDFADVKFSEMLFLAGRSIFDETIGDFDKN